LFVVVFVCLLLFCQSAVQLLVLTELPVLASPLVEGGRFSEFVHEVMALVSEDYLTQVDLAKALVKGLSKVLSGGGMAQAVVDTMVCAVSQLCARLSVAVTRDVAGGGGVTWEQVLSYLLDTELWTGVASCLTSIEVCVCVTWFS